MGDRKVATKDTLAGAETSKGTQPQAAQHAARDRKPQCKMGIGHAVRNGDKYELAVEMVEIVGTLTELIWYQGVLRCVGFDQLAKLPRNCAACR